MKVSQEAIHSPILKQAQEDTPDRYMLSIFERPPVLMIPQQISVACSSSYLPLQSESCIHLPLSKLFNLFLVLAWVMMLANIPFMRIFHIFEKIYPRVLFAKRDILLFQPCLIYHVF